MSKWWHGFLWRIFKLLRELSDFPLVLASFLLKVWNGYWNWFCFYFDKSLVHFLLIQGPLTIEYKTTLIGHNFFILLLFGLLRNERGQLVILVRNAWQVALKDKIRLMNVIAWDQCNKSHETGKHYQEGENRVLGELINTTTAKLLLWSLFLFLVFNQLKGSRCRNWIDHPLVMVIVIIIFIIIIKISCMRWDLIWLEITCHHGLIVSRQNKWLLGIVLQLIVIDCQTNNILRY